jgi:GT2 family glycosyltransferase/glycosyltransferase involved in cell wall biosynthesis
MVKVLFASASEAVIALVTERMKSIFPEVPLVVVSEFEPPAVEWIKYHIKRTPQENEAFILARLAGRGIRLGAIILEPRTPHGALRKLGRKMSPRFRLLIFNENGQHFMMRPDNLHVMLRHGLWRTGNLIRSQMRPRGTLYEGVKLLKDPVARRLSILYRRALARGRWLAENRRPAAAVNVETTPKPDGISVVIPTRNGRELLAECLALLDGASEIIVVDNGSSDGSTEFLRDRYPDIVVEHSAEPLSFARAVNRGIRKARFSRVCLLNNDMLVEPGFLAALRRPFEMVPNLFSSTAQIFFPEGQRREETGKTVLPDQRPVLDFPVRCDELLAGEDQSYVLYGSGGCSLYDAAKLEALSGFDEAYDPAYVEDLDLGVRAWTQGWPSVFAAQARVLHKHRTTTSRYFTQAELEDALELNYVRFLARAIGDATFFGQLWRENTLRLKANKKARALELAARLEAAAVLNGDSKFFDLVSGHVAVFPGRASSGKPVVLIASPYLPYPLSHGAAVRIYNLMRRAAPDFDQVLIAFVETARPVPVELLGICIEVITVQRPGSHALPSTERPDTVEEFDSPAFHAALRQTIGKWRPRIVQLEFTQMAQYAADCAGARTLLVEHDITYDLYAQMLKRGEEWETRRQYERWLKFERHAWGQVDRVVTMSEQDRELVDGSVAIGNGVDLERFHPTGRQCEARRLLFIGSFAHRPNVLAMEFFLSNVFPLLRDVTLHVIAGQNHERFWNLDAPHVEVEGFVSDVRPAYERATLVIAPLVASAGTNIKIMEAMAMGKAIVSTEAGIHGLELARGEDLVVADSAVEMAAAINRLLDFPEERSTLERHARETAVRVYGWDAMAREQRRLYEDLLGRP